MTEPQPPSSSEVVRQAADALKETFGDAPRMAFVLGSGLTPVVEAVQGAARADASSLGLPTPRVAGHGAEIVVGTLAGIRVAVASGRVHLYEGHAPEVVVRTVRALHAWGVRGLLLTNAAGSVHGHLPPGTLVRLVDHLDLTARSPLIGADWGTRFPPGDGAWCPRLGAILDDVAQAEGVSVPHGVYAALTGPAYETPAEVRMLRTLGADVVGMSTVPEALAASALGLRAVGLSVVTNFGAGVVDAAVDHGRVQAVAGEAAAQVVRLLRGAVGPWHHALG